MPPILRLLPSSRSLRRPPPRPPPSRSSSSSAVTGSDDEDDDGDGEMPIAGELFRRPLRAGGYTQGDATFVRLARALADADPLDFGGLRRLLAALRCRPHPTPEAVLLPVLRALRLSGRPLAALRLFLRLSSRFRCSPSHLSLNSALTSLLSSPLPPSLALPFFFLALRRNPSISPNLLTYNLILKSLSGDPDRALSLLRRLPFRPDSYSYATVVAAFARAPGRLPDALALLDEISVDGASPPPAAFNAVLRPLLQQSPAQAADLLRHMRLKGAAFTLATYNTLAHGLAVAGRLPAAAAILRRMAADGLRPNAVTYGAVIHGLVLQNRPSDAKLLFDQMESDGLQPNEFVYSALMNGFFRAGDATAAVSLWAVMRSKGIKPNEVLFSVLVNGFFHCGDVEAAERAFDEMTAEDCTPNIMTFSSMIRGYFKAGNSQRALETWKEMIKRGIEPNEISYSILIHGLCEEGRLKEGMMVWKNMLSRGCAADVVAYSSMIKGMCGAGMVDGGLRLFYDMLASNDVEPDVVTYNILFDGLISRGNLSRAMDLLGRMLDRGCNPDRVTCNIFLKGVMGEEGKGREFLEGLVLGLTKRGEVRAASEILEVMLKKCVTPRGPIWDVVLRGVCKRKRVSMVIEKCWGEMWR